MKHMKKTEAIGRIRNCRPGISQNLNLNIVAYNVRGLGSSVVDVIKITDGLDLLFSSET